MQTLRQTKKTLLRCYIAKRNCLLFGKPGIGKTMLVNAFARDMQQADETFKIWPLYGVTMNPTDIQMAMPNMDTKRLEFFSTASLPNGYETPDATGIVFMGEMPNMDAASAKAFQKYINGEDMNGQMIKPKNVIIVADGNRMEDKSGVLTQYRALMSRFHVKVEVYSTPDENIAYARKENFHPYVQDFFRVYPQHIDNYEEVFGSAKVVSEEGKLGIWASMRSWETISELEYAGETLDSPPTLEEICGALGTGIGAAYEGHRAMILNLASLEEIVADPINVRLPENIGEMYALASIVSMRIAVDKLDKARLFGMRLPKDLQVYMLRTLQLRKDFEAHKTPVFTKWMNHEDIASLLQGAPR